MSGSGKFLASVQHGTKYITIMGTISNWRPISAVKLMITLGLITLTFGWLPIKATTIQPYSGLPALQQEAYAIVYVDCIADNMVAVRATYKGSSPPVFVVRRYAPEGAVIFGDVELSAGKSYLLFLDSLNRPLLLSYYIYEELGLNLVPVEQAQQIHPVRQHQHGGYNRDSLFMFLRSGGPVPAMKAIVTKRSAPQHCTYLSSGGTRYRWEQMPVTALHVIDTSSCGAHGEVGAALGDLNLNFPNIEYINGGIVVPGSGCGSGTPTAIGTHYRNWLDANYNRSTGVVFFNDPCSEINNLSNCSGVLAFGGGYGIGTHTFRGATWYSLRYPFVVMNNGLECICENVGIILKHELTHTLGIGHISSSNGAALMNPSCCNDITALDVSCVDYSYPCGELNEWTGNVSTNWMTAGNWTAGVPGDCDIVFIPENKTVLIAVGQDARAGLIEVDGILDTRGTLNIVATDVYVDTTSPCLGFTAYFDYIPDINCAGAKIKPRVVNNQPCVPDQFLWYLNGNLMPWGKDSIVAVSSGETHVLVQTCSELNCEDSLEFVYNNSPAIYLSYNQVEAKVNLIGPPGLQRSDVSWYCKHPTIGGWAFCTGTSYSTYSANAQFGYRYYARVRVGGITYFTHCVAI